MKNKKTNKKLMSTVAVASAFAVVVGGAFAFFNDTADFSEQVNVGTVDINVTGDLLHSNALNNLNPGDNDPTVSTQARPGTDHELSFEINNLGNKSVITRTIIEVSGLRRDGQTILTEKELMNIIFSEKANVVAVTTQANIATSDVNKQTEIVRLTPTGYSDNKLVYIIGGTRGDQDALNGTGDMAETEENVTTTKLVKTFDIGLDKSSDSNLYAGAVITINVKVQAMQYRNTEDNTWNTIFEKAYTTGGTPDVSAPGGDINDQEPEYAKTGMMVSGANFWPAVKAVYPDTDFIENIKFIEDDTGLKGSTFIGDLTAEKDGSIDGWVYGNTLYVSSTTPATKILLNKDCSEMFRYFKNVTSIDFGNVDTSEVTNMKRMFGVGESHPWPNDLLKCIELDLSNFNTSKVTNMNGMFANLPNLTTIILGDEWDTSNVQDISYMFENSKVTLDCSDWDVSNVNNHEYFNTNATSIIAPTWNN